MSVSYNHDREDAARTAALRAWGVGAKPDTRGDEEPQDILRLHDRTATPEQLALPAPYSALVHATNMAARVVLETMAQVIGEESKRTDKKLVDIDAKVGAEGRAADRRFDAIEQKFTDLAARVAKAELENASLKGELADLVHQVERDRTARGHTDGRQLPAALQRKVRSTAKRARTSSEATAWS
jgi:hypothetical protein